MKLTSTTAGALLAASALAHPLSLDPRQSAPLDVVVLEFALTLEHLENVFYKGALKNFTAQDFIDAGYSATYYNNLNYIAHDEEVHVQYLTSAITAAGYAPVAACTYKFPYTDVASFITLSSVLEGVGTSAYLAGAPLISNKAYLTAAGSILVTEALHTSLQRGAIGEVPMANPFGTPLDPTSVYTLAAMFITSCPASNFALPFTPFPTLTYDAAGSCSCEEPDCTPSNAIKARNVVPSPTWSAWDESSATPYYPAPTTTMAHVSSSAAPIPTAAASCAPPSAGATIKLTAASAVPAGSYVTFVNGLSISSVTGTISGADISAAIPSGTEGQTYVFITNSNVEGTFSDAAVLFGPAIVEVDPAPPTINYSVL